MKLGFTGVYIVSLFLLQNITNVKNLCILRGRVFVMSAITRVGVFFDMSAITLVLKCFYNLCILRGRVFVMSAITLVLKCFYNLCILRGRFFVMSAITLVLKCLHNVR